MNKETAKALSRIERAVKRGLRIWGHTSFTIIDAVRGEILAIKRELRATASPFKYRGTDEASEGKKIGKASTMKLVFDVASKDELRATGKGRKK